MGTRKKLVFTLCALFLATGLIVAGVFAATSASFTFRNRASFVASNGVNVSVSISGTNGGDIITSISNPNFNVYEGQSITPESSVQQVFKGSGIENAIIYTIQITNNGSLNTFIELNEILGDTNISVSLTYFIGSDEITDASNLIIEQNETLVVTITYILSPDATGSSYLDSDVEFDMSTTTNSRGESGPGGIVSNGLTLESTPKTIYGIGSTGSIMSDVNSYVVRKVSDNSVLMSKPVKVSDAQGNIIYNYNDLAAGIYAAGIYTVRIYDMADQNCYVEYQISVTSLYNSVSVAGINYSNPSYTTYLQNYNRESFNENVAISASFDSSNYHCIAMIGGTFIELQSGVTINWYSPKPIVEEQGLSVTYKLFDNQSYSASLGGNISRASQFFGQSSNLSWPEVKVEVKSQCYISNINLVGISASDFRGDMTSTRSVTNLGYMRKSSANSNGFDYYFSDWATSGRYSNTAFIGSSVPNENCAHNKVIDIQTYNTAFWVLDVSITLDPSLQGYTYLILRSGENLELTDVSWNEKIIFEVYIRNQSNIVVDAYSISVTSYPGRTIFFEDNNYSNVIKDEGGYIQVSPSVTSEIQAGTKTYHTAFDVYNGTNYTSSIVSCQIFDENMTPTTLTSFNGTAQIYNIRFTTQYNSKTYNLTCKTALINNVSYDVMSCSGISTRLNGQYINFQFNNSAVQYLDISEIEDYLPSNELNSSNTSTIANMMSADTMSTINIFRQNGALEMIGSNEYHVTYSGFSDDFIVVSVYRNVGNELVYQKYCRIEYGVKSSDGVSGPSAQIYWDSSVMAMPSGVQMSYNPTLSRIEYNPSIAIGSRQQLPFKFVDPNPTVTIDSSCTNYIELMYEEDVIVGLYTKNITSPVEVLFTVTASDDSESMLYYVNIVPGQSKKFNAALGNMSTNDQFDLIEENHARNEEGLVTAYNYNLIIRNPMEISSSVQEIAMNMGGPGVPGSVNTVLYFNGLFNEVYFNNTLYMTGNTLAIPVTTTNDEGVKASISGYVKDIKEQNGYYKPITINVIIYNDDPYQTGFSFGDPTSSLEVLLSNSGFVFKGFEVVDSQGPMSASEMQTMLQPSVVGSLGSDLSRYTASLYQVKGNLSNPSIMSGDPSSLRLRVNGMLAGTQLYDYMDDMMNETSDPLPFIDMGDYGAVDLIMLPACDLGEVAPESQNYCALEAVTVNPSAYTITVFVFVISFFS